MAAQQVNMRIRADVLAQIDAAAAEAGASRTDIIMDAILAYLSGHEPEAAPAPRSPTPTSPRRSATTVAPKVDRARTALVAAEARQGVAPTRAAPRLDTSMVAVHDGSKRPAYQKGQAGQGKAGGKVRGR